METQFQVVDEQAIEYLIQAVDGGRATETQVQIVNG